MRHCFSVRKIYTVTLVCHTLWERDIKEAKEPTHPFLSKHTWYVAPCHTSEKKLYQCAAHSLQHENSCIWPGTAQYFVRG